MAGARPSDDLELGLRSRSATNFPFSVISSRSSRQQITVEPVRRRRYLQYAPTRFQSISDGDRSTLMTGVGCHKWVKCGWATK